MLEEALRLGVPSRGSFHAALGGFAKALSKFCEAWHGQDSRLADAVGRLGRCLPSTQEGIVKAMRAAKVQPDVRAPLATALLNLFLGRHLGVAASGQ